MYFRVKKEFRWNGKTYKPGEHIELEEGNPRTSGLAAGNFITNDATSPVKKK